MSDAEERFLDNEEEKFNKDEKYAKLRDIEKGDFELVIPTRYKPEAIDLSKFNLSVSYTFSSGVRLNNFVTSDGTMLKYGSSNMTYRRLYIILCECFNGGTRFIDTYFDCCFGPHMGRQAKEIGNKVKKSFEDYNNKFDEAMDAMKWRKDGEMDRRSRGYRIYEKLKTWKPVDVKSDLRAFSLEVKADIKRCLASGLIPLSFHNHSKYTVALRERLGFTPVTAFYASGQLIDHVTLYFKVALDDD